MTKPIMLEDYTDFHDNNVDINEVNNCPISSMRSNRCQVRSLHRDPLYARSRHGESVTRQSVVWRTLTFTGNPGYLKTLK